MTSIQSPTEYKVAVILTDANRRIQWVNQDFTLITGYSIEEVIGKKPSLLQGKGTKQTSIERIRKKLSLQAPFKDEILNYRKNGEEYPCRLVVHPIFDDDNTLINFIAFEIDATHIEDDSEISLLQLQPKYQSSSLSNTQEFDLYSKLVAIVEEEKLYLDPDLKLKYLADRLNTNTRYLSQVINHQTGHNLIHFINTYRVKEVKNKLVDDAFQHLTAFGIAQNCGFKNKSTFYKVFKEVTTLTPNEFIKQQGKGVA